VGESNMPEPKKFTAAMDSDARKSPLRVAFVTRRTSPQVKAHDDDYVMTFPEALFRGTVAVEVLTLALVVVALLWDAPLEELANPLQTPNPAKAPWYFLGLQELLHYFPPVVAGVLIPALVILALIAIPYFHINIADEPLWSRHRAQRLRTLASVSLAFSIFLIYFGVYASLVPTLLVAGLMWFSAGSAVSPSRFRGWLSAKPLSFWIMSWFLLQATVLTLIGTFFRGPGWSLVMPWSG
jgi:quinol---cytochrome c reductase cytochrome c subunit, bacillus type